MTPAQVIKVIDFMRDYAIERDAVPSVKQIAQGAGISIRKTRRIMTLLEEKGMLRRTIRGFVAPKVQP